MFKYSEFVQTIKKEGIAKQNRFFINIALPGLNSEFANLYSATSPQFRKVNMFCKSINFQGVSFSSNPTRTHGEVFEAPYDRNFGGFSASFYVDRNMYVRKFFDEWADSIQNPNTRNFSYYKDFVSTEVTLYVLDSLERVNYVVMFFDVFPKSIGALSLDQGSNEAMTIDVTFDYHFYKTFVVDQVATESTPGYAGINGGNGSSPLPEDGYDGVNPVGAAGITGIRPPSTLGSSTKGFLASSVMAAAALKTSGVSAIQNSAKQLQNTFSTNFGSVTGAVNNFNNDFLGFQEGINQGIGSLNSVTADIRSVLNAPKDVLNSSKGTIRNVSYGVKNFKNTFNLFK